MQILLRFVLDVSSLFLNNTYFYSKLFYFYLTVTPRGRVLLIKIKYHTWTSRYTSRRLANVINDWLSKTKTERPSVLSSFILSDYDSD